MLMNPGPATSGTSKTSPVWSRDTTSAATSFGGRPSFFARAIAQFAW